MEGEGGGYWKPLRLRQQGNCGEVESGIIERFFGLHWLKQKRES